jgi:hypothetical protein
MAAIAHLRKRSWRTDALFFRLFNHTNRREHAVARRGICGSAMASGGDAMKAQTFGTAVPSPQQQFDQL